MTKAKSVPPKFLIWSNRYIEGKCVVDAPEQIPDMYQLNKGVSRSRGWPKKAVCRMSDDYPKDLELADNLYGTRFVIISPAVRDFLDAARVNKVEYLPVQVYNHKKRLASADYFLLNPLGQVNCIDIEASAIKWNAINPEVISSCKKLVLEEPNVPNNVKIFRPKHLPHEILIRSELAKKLTDAGLTGLHFKDPAKFRGV